MNLGKVRLDRSIDRGLALGRHDQSFLMTAVFAEVINADDFDLPNRELAIDYVLGGVHSALIAIAHSPPSRRGRATSQIADLVVRTLA